MTELIDKKVDRYQIKELIGQGAMANVYRVYDPEIDRSLALKILKSDLTISDEYLSRFLKEAKAAGALSHHNILTVFDVGKLDNTPYILMELLNHGDLSDLLAKRKRVGVKDTLIIALQLAKALNYAHEAGVVHRDIKPDNIMLLEDQVSIKVTDFGIARLDESDEANKTQVGSVLGTPRYMSPEQALGKEVDGRSDLYSVGVILHEMLTGEKAFDASNLGTLMTQIIQQQPTSLKQLYPDLPSGLCHIVQKLLSKKPEKRYQTGAELAAALSKELRTLNEQEAESNKDKYIPLKVRWTLSMAGIVAVVMMISAMVVFNIQKSAMSKQAIDSGAEVAKLISIESAVPLLSEDWITLETFVNEASKRQTFSYLVVTDRDGIVRGASDTSLIGQPYQASADKEFLQIEDDITTSSIEIENKEKVFNIEAPVLFQEIKVGQIILGLSQKNLDRVTNVTGWLMFFLGLVTVLSVSTVLYVFGVLIGKPIKLINTSIISLIDGQYDTRISFQRNDELGLVFDSFNTLASKIETLNTTSNDDVSIEHNSTTSEATEQSEADKGDLRSPLVGADDIVDDATIVRTVKDDDSAVKKAAVKKTTTRARKTTTRKRTTSSKKPAAKKAKAVDTIDDNDLDKTVIANVSSASEKSTSERKLEKQKDTSAQEPSSVPELEKADLTDEDIDKTVIAKPKQSAKKTTVRKTKNG